MLKTTVCKWATADGNIVSSINTYGNLAGQLAAQGPQADRATFKKTAYHFYKDIWSALYDAQKQLIRSQKEGKRLAAGGSTSNAPSPAPSDGRLNSRDEEWGDFICAPPPVSQPDPRGPSRPWTHATTDMLTRGNATPRPLKTSRRELFPSQPAPMLASPRTRSASPSRMPEAVPIGITAPAPSPSGPGPAAAPWGTYGTRHPRNQQRCGAAAAPSPPKGSYAPAPGRQPSDTECTDPSVRSLDSSSRSSSSLSSSNPSATGGASDASDCSDRGEDTTWTPPEPGATAELPASEHARKSLACSISMQRRLYETLSRAAAANSKQADGGWCGVRGAAAAEVCCVVTISSGARLMLQHAQALLKASIREQEERAAEAVRSSSSRSSNSNNSNCSSPSFGQTKSRGRAEAPAALPPRPPSKLCGSQTASQVADLLSTSATAAEGLRSCRVAMTGQRYSPARTVSDSGIVRRCDAESDGIVGDGGEELTPPRSHMRAAPLAHRLRSLKRLPWEARELQGDKTQEGISQAAVRREEGRVALQAALSGRPCW